MRLPTLTFAMFMGLSVGALVANLTITQKGVKGCLSDFNTLAQSAMPKLPSSYCALQRAGKLQLQFSRDKPLI